MQSSSRRPVRWLSGIVVLLCLAFGSLGARAHSAIPLEPMEDPLFGVATVVPEGWVALGQGLHARVPGVADRVLLAIQSAPVGVDALWAGLLPQLGLGAVPEPSGSRATDAFEWTLYGLEVAAPTGALHVDLALADADGTALLVLLQSPPQDADVLREAVFLPAVDALELFAPDPTVDPATLPYGVVEVTFPGGGPGVTLAGTLTVPSGPGPHPAVVLLSGSGPQDRDESLRPVSAIKPFALLADALTRAGIAVLRYDDRGTAASTGDHATARLADLTADAEAAFRFLAARPEVDEARTGMLGHSEGGVYIASLLDKGLPAAFAVGLAAPATNGVDLLVTQNAAIARTNGMDEAGVQRTESFVRELYAAILRGDMAAARAVAEAYFGAEWDLQTPDVQAALGERAAWVAAQAGVQLAAVDSPWFVDLLRSDAGIGWDGATIPVLGVFGGKDVQVLADQNAPLMERQLADGDPASRVVTLPDANHLFQAALTGSIAEYGTLEPAFTPELLPLVIGWLTERTGPPTP